MNELSWYKITLDSDNDTVLEIEELTEDFSEADGDGLGISAFDEEDNELFTDAAEVIKFSDGEIIASFDSEKMTEIIKMLNDDRHVEVSY